MTPSQKDEKIAPGGRDEKARPTFLAKKTVDNSESKKSKALHQFCSTC